MAPIEYPPLKPGNFLRALEAKVPQKFVRDILNRLRFRDQAPLSDAALFVPLQDVHAAYAPDPDKGAPEFRRRHSGLVRGGDWDLSIKPLEDSFKHIACRLHFLEGKPWEDTGVYERHLQNIAKRGESDGCRTLEDLKRRYAGIDRLYEEVSRSGRLRPRSEVPGYFRREHGGIFVHIDRNGRALRRGGGEHRYAIARILDLPEIPVQPGVIHIDALRHGHLDRLRRSIHD
ncbi:hypothetical protein MALG_01067 [Marinovum algicola DG 898]|nr:hypothetical protein MALG_01067 [Marinovum algicola DG 898]